MFGGGVKGKKKSNQFFFFGQFHAWVIEDLPNPEQWIRDTEPSGYHDDDFEGEEVVADHVQVIKKCSMHVLSMWDVYPFQVD
jgi:hypothetical protein